MQLGARFDFIDRQLELLVHYYPKVVSWVVFRMTYGRCDVPLCKQTTESWPTDHAPYMVISGVAP